MEFVYKSYYHVLLVKCNGGAITDYGVPPGRAVDYDNDYDEGRMYW